MQSVECLYLTALLNKSGSVYCPVKLRRGHLCRTKNLNSTEQMEVQDQIESDWSRHFSGKPLAELNTSSRSYCSAWMDTEPAMFKTSNSRSFAMDARIRLDHLKSGCKSPSACCAMDGTLFNYNCERDVWESEPKEEESVLDSVELLDVDDGEQDEESWLYESPKKPVEKTESALRWCRHVLDNHSPEMEAACRQLTNSLDQRSSSHFNRRPPVFQHPVIVGPSVDKSSVNMMQNPSDSFGDSELGITHEAINTDYRLEDITDVCIMARIQEASLRQDYMSTPAAVSSQRGAKSPSHCNTLQKSDDLIAGNKTEASSPSHWQQRFPSPSSSPSSRSCQSPTPVTKQSCQSPNLARLRQQVTQFKLLKLAQSRATSSVRTSSPARTSLRSLQAVRNGRSLDTDDCLPADPVTPSASGASSTRIGSSCWSPSLSAASMNSSVWMAAMKTPPRCQSLSPCRITQSAKGYLSRHGRVFASPERSTPVAWARNCPSTQ
uniref:SLAIN motif-containing protein-like isoform X2 n=1 Tax=Solea senegalensis TaxID=28829 RepID=UPI001CD8ADD3|nr:SLAIN motif-containing protein-like isoform X2 [Solea senegalensis]